MRQLTFTGFLKQYLPALSLHGSTGVYALAAEAASENSRLREPLCLYAVLAGKEDTLLSAVQTLPISETVVRFLNSVSPDLLIKKLEKGTMPYEYQKVWNSYQSLAKKRQGDQRTKAMLRQKVLSLQAEQKVSTYSICKNLSLNNSNVCTWLRNGDSNMVTLDAAERIYRYLTARC